MVPTSGKKVTVTLDRGSKTVSYGFGLGTTTGGQDVVTSVTEGGPADGVLEVTDMIEALNGEDAGNLTHQDIIDRIVAGTSIEITVLRVQQAAEEKKAFNKKMAISKRAPNMQVQNRQDDLGTATAAIYEQAPTGEKPYACSICPKRFGQKNHVARHERTHTGEKPYACSMCPRRFTNKSNVAPHERTHTGE